MSFVSLFQETFLTGYPLFFCQIKFNKASFQSNSRPVEQILGFFTLWILTFSNSWACIKLTASFQCQIIFRKFNLFTIFDSFFIWIESKMIKLSPCQFISRIFWAFIDFLPFLPHNLNSLFKQNRTHVCLSLIRKSLKSTGSQLPE